MNFESKVVLATTLVALVPAIAAVFAAKMGNRKGVMILITLTSLFCDIGLIVAKQGVLAIIFTGAVLVAVALETWLSRKYP